MKRREFLTLLSAAGIGAAMVDGLTTEPLQQLSAEALRQGSVRFSPDRQGFGYPVRVSLHLPNAGPLPSPPSVVIAREGENRWSDRLDPDQAERGDLPNSWRWDWKPPPGRPTDSEQRDEVIRFRAVLIEASNRSVGLCSNALEVVCARRGWGC